MDQGLDAIRATLSDYFDGIYDGSEDKLRSAFHPNAHIYAATDGGKISCSYDGGQEWEQLPVEFPAIAIGSLVVA